MTDQKALEEYTGFTEDEVKRLCAQYQMNFEEAKAWYDGYQLTNHHIYCPRSVVECMLHQKFYTYWNQTETYEALKVYIQMDMDGLKDAVVEMIAGNSVRISTGTFSNDMTTFAGKDDVLTLLVHLGYLTYDKKDGTGWKVLRSIKDGRAQQKVVSPFPVGRAVFVCTAVIVL